MQTKYLTGDELTYADVIIAFNLAEPIKTVDKKTMKSSKKVTEWLNSLKFN